MNRRPPFAALIRVTGALCGVALVVGCSASADVDDAELAPTSGDAVPHWIREGVRLARAESQASAPSVPTTPTTAVTAAPSDTVPGGLPSREVVVSALTGTGLTAEQAGCVYDKVAADSQVSADVAALVSGLTTASPGNTAAIPALSPEGSTRLLTSVAPCLDQATLVSLMAAGQGAGGDTQLSALLNSAQGLDLSKLAGFDANTLAKALAGNLGADQVRQLQALLAAAGTTQALPANPLANLDIANLDLSALTAEQAPLLALALMRGLTAAQQQQLTRLTKVTFEDLDIDIDPDTLTPEEIGRLLLILSPVLAGAINVTPVTAPPGADPTQVYVPPGADLSNINPLIFLNRADVIAEFGRQGVPAPVAACIFDRMSRLPPTTIAAFFSSEAQESAATAVLLTAVSCIAGG